MTTTPKCPKCGTGVDVAKALEAQGMHIRCACGASLHLLWTMAEGASPQFFVENVDLPEPAITDDNQRVHIFPRKA